MSVPHLMQRYPLGSHQRSSWDNTTHNIAFFKWRLVAPSFLTARGTQVCDSLAQVGHEVKHGGSQTLVDEVAWQTALGGQKRLVKGENTLAYEGSRQRQYTVARMYKTVLVTNQCLT